MAVNKLLRSTRNQSTCLLLFTTWIHGGQCVCRGLRNKLRLDDDKCRYLDARIDLLPRRMSIVQIVMRVVISRRERAQECLCHNNFMMMMNETVFDQHEWRDLFPVSNNSLLFCYRWRFCEIRTFPCCGKKFQIHFPSINHPLPKINRLISSPTTLSLHRYIFSWVSTLRIIFEWTK